MDLIQSFVKFFEQNGIATGILFFMGWFLVNKVWPWYTTIYMPIASTRQDSRDRMISELRDAILELKALTAQLVVAIQQHDTSTRDLVIALGSNQQAILDLLTEHDAVTLA